MKRRKAPLKKPRSRKGAASRVLKKSKKQSLAKAQNGPNWKKQSKWGKTKKYLPEPAQVDWKIHRRKRIKERFEHEGKKLRSRLYYKLDEFKNTRKRKYTKTVGHAYRLVILADADFGMSNPSISDEAAYNLQYWTTSVVRTRKESREEIIELLRRAEEVVTEFASFEVLRVIRLEFHANKDGSYAVTEYKSKVPSFKKWRPE